MSEISKNDGWPAFPTAGWCDGSKTPLGMSIRDWFAGQALVGLLASHTKNLPYVAFAAQAYGIADAMLKAREQ